LTDRAAARRLAHEAVGDGEPLRWFEELYAAAGAGEAAVPWADLAVNPSLAGWEWFDPGRMRRVLVVGCGYGDDAEWLAARGCEVTAFDISPTAIEACRARFPASAVTYEKADLLAPPVAWLERPFDLVVEAYTAQVFAPGSAERAAVIAALVPLTGGLLLVIARGREEHDDPGSMPWPLTAGELEPLEHLGLRLGAFEDYLDDERSPVRRFRASYLRAG
jgi:SAM-dependent methyltransferase